MSQSVTLIGEMRTPVNGSTNLTMATSAATPPGTYDLMVNASSGLIQRHIPAKLIVQPKPFTILVSPSTQTITSPGQPAAYTVTVTPAGGFSGPVSLLGPGGLPPGASASYSPSTLPNGSGAATLTVTTSATTPSGTSTSNVRGSGGSITQSAPATLVVDNSGDFGLTVTSA